MCAHEKVKTEDKRGKWKETKSEGEEHRAERGVRPTRASGASS